MEKDLRSCERADCKAGIVFSLFNQSGTRTGSVINCSEGGLLFTTDRPFHIGSTIFIRLSGSETVLSSRPGMKGPRTVSMAEVRWCREEDLGHNIRYRMGAKYLIPV